MVSFIYIYIIYIYIYIYVYNIYIYTYIYIMYIIYLLDLSTIYGLMHVFRRALDSLVDDTADRVV